MSLIIGPFKYVNHFNKDRYFKREVTCEIFQTWIQTWRNSHVIFKFTVESHLICMLKSSCETHVRIHRFDSHVDLRLRDLVRVGSNGGHHMGNWVTGPAGTSDLSVLNIWKKDALLKTFNSSLSQRCRKVSDMPAKPVKFARVWQKLLKYWTKCLTGSSNSVFVKCANRSQHQSGGWAQFIQVFSENNLVRTGVIRVYAYKN